MSGIVNKDCECWDRTAALNFADRGFPKEAVLHLYCPRCSPGIRKDDIRMVEKNGWLMEYDPSRLRPLFGTVCLIQSRREPSSFLIYVDRARQRSAHTRRQRV